MIFFRYGLPSRFAELCDGADRASPPSIASARWHWARSQLRGHRDRGDPQRCGISRSPQSRQPVVRLQTEIAAPAGRSGGARRRALGPLGPAAAATLRHRRRDPRDRQQLRGDADPDQGAGRAGAARHPRRGPRAAGGRDRRPFRLRGPAPAISPRSAASAAELDVEPSEDLTWTDRLSAHEQAVVTVAFAALCEPILPAAIWSRSSGGRSVLPNEERLPAIGPIDVTGRGRILVFGPYFNLPPGQWSATIVIGFSAETDPATALSSK